MRKSPNFDIIIVGGGVIGWSIAYYATKYQLSVCVVDPYKNGGHASTVAAGLICPSPQLTKPSAFATIALASVKLFPELDAELREASGVDIQLQQCGTLRIATSEEQAQNQQKRLPFQQQLGIDLQWLTADEVRKIEPAITVPIFGAVYGPQEGQITGKRLMLAYQRAASKQGAVSKIGRCQQLIVNDKGPRITGITTANGERIESKQVILASGAWTAQLMQTLSFMLPIEPERGQISVLGHIVTPPKHIIFGEQIYLAPKANNTVIIGGIKDRGNFTEHTSVQGISELLRKGILISNKLGEASIKNTLAGIRPRTIDGLPIIGAVPGYEGLHVAAGHNSNGLLLSAITGQMIIANLLQQPATIDSTPYSPRRFIKETNIELAS